jgi:hypothetical protein
MGVASRRYKFGFKNLSNFDRQVCVANGPPQSMSCGVPCAGWHLDAMA